VANTQRRGLKKGLAGGEGEQRKGGKKKKKNKGGEKEEGLWCLARWVFFVVSREDSVSPYSFFSPFFSLFFSFQ